MPSEQPRVLPDEPEAPSRPVMVDDRTPSQRLADIRKRVVDMKNTFAAEIDRGKPCLIHPIVVPEMDFLLEHIDRQDKVIARLTRQVESLEGASV